MDEIKEMLHTLIQRQDAIDKKLDAIAAQQTELAAELRKISNPAARDDIQAQLDYVAQKLGQHDRDLYVLKRKQTDKEAAR
ncbi:hypothetical protein [Paenibacillus ehimensis]|uniref:Uncharacterized protein n=1 Tax=Paenibacillus ehimensis TaxID=79264 RepID=A0ABT8VMG3_9BACL|nr:hypothetical protein [Paenibacillus ehimensis]MDO3682173.1 hypothetical protein [Paenibacillus ehimensis]